MTSLAQIMGAEHRIRPFVRRTPLLNAPMLDEIAGRRVFVKAENLQHTGSFKFRGAMSALSALSDEERKRGILAMSSGNHAQGIAMAAKHFETKAVIVMPADAPKAKMDATRLLGAEIVTYDRASEDREAVAQRLHNERPMTLVAPFDNSQVIAGQGTVGLEIVEEAAHVGVQASEVLVCCGGGGLTSGVALAVERHGMTVRPVEPVGFDDVTRSLSSGVRMSNAQTVGSICDAIITPMPGAMTFPIMQRLCGAGIVVPEEDCLRAMALAYAQLKIVLEPGGAIALAAALFHGEQIRSDDIIVTASGGNVDPKQFAQALALL